MCDVDAVVWWKHFLLTMLLPVCVAPRSNTASSVMVTAICAPHFTPPHPTPTNTHQRTVCGAGVRVGLWRCEFLVGLEQNHCNLFGSPITKASRTILDPGSRPGSLSIPSPRHQGTACPFVSKWYARVYVHATARAGGHPTPYPGSHPYSRVQQARGTK